MSEFKSKPNILVVCGRNKRRSRTAEYLYKNDSRINVKSAGLSAQSEVVLNAKLVEWADLIIVMDNTQKNRIQDQFRTSNLPRIENINIEDEYEYLDSGLIDLLKERINNILRRFSIFEN